MPPHVADGEGKRREITLSVTVGDSSPEVRADCNARSPKKIIVCVWCLLRDVGTKFQAKSHLISRANGLTNAFLREEGGIRVNLNELYFRINQRMTEGERGTFGLTKCYFFEKYYYAGSFHHFVVPLPPGGRLL